MNRKHYAVIEDDGRLQIVQEWTLIAEMNEDRNGYVDPDLGRRQWAAALERAYVMVDALNAALGPRCAACDRVLPTEDPAPVHPGPSAWWDGFCTEGCRKAAPGGAA